MDYCYYFFIIIIIIIIGLTATKVIEVKETLTIIWQINSWCFIQFCLCFP